MQRIREGVDAAVRPLDFAGLELSIPELDYYVLQQRFPDLASTDNATRLAAWKKFMASPESDIYRVRKRVRVSK